MTDRIVVKQSPNKSEIYTGEPLELHASLAAVN
jgi:hypothetical protein